jgi:hypothetical protein
MGMELEQIKGFIHTPLLWAGNLQGVEQFIFPEPEMTNFKVQPIPQNIRLGHQVEHIFRQLLDHGKIYEILLFNQPIKNENRTIGEIDFIVKDHHSQQVIHIELTYKFYIINDQIKEKIHQLIGPNKKDNFYQKIQKIKQQQFKLIQSKEAINLFKSKSIDEKNIISKAFFKAQLFLPYMSNDINISPFNSACICGFWLGLEDFETTDFYEQLYYFPTKKEWIIAPHENVVWKTFKETLILIKERHSYENSPMVWIRKSDALLGKFFIVW